MQIKQIDVSVMPKSNNIKLTSYALALLMFIVITGFLPLADEALLIIFAIGTIFILPSRYKADRLEMGLVVTGFGYFVIAIMCAWLFGESLGIHSFTGLYELWRGHIALIWGLILSRHVSVKHKNEMLYALVLALKINILFCLFQTVIGEQLIEMMMGISTGNLEQVEYRGGFLRTVGFFTNANLNAWFIALCLYLLNTQHYRSIFWAILGLVALVTTGSRSVLLLTVIIIILQHVQYTGISVTAFIQKYVLYIFISVALIASISLFNEKSTATGYTFIPEWDVITEIDSASVTDSYFRAFALHASMARFLESPLVGLGPGTYGTPSSFRSQSEYLHEDGFGPYIDAGMTQLDLLIPILLPETGVLGLIVWVALLYYLLRDFHRRSLDSPRSMALFWWCLMLVASSFIGPGITHPLVVALLPLLVSCTDKPVSVYCGKAN